MIVSLNPDPERSEFDLLLNSTLQELNDHAIKDPKKVARLLGRDLEPFVKDVMTDLAVGTVFQDSIELIGGQKFPDIVAKKFYGIEVKTTKSNHWKTTGNSVFEGTRVGSVERVFMMFAKLAHPVEFRCRPYEDVLSEIVVTHSPRYLIDMDLVAGNTIFDKINMPYDTLRKEENPIRPIIEYYKTRLKPGEELWWMDQDAKSNSSFVIKIWNNLSAHEKYSYTIRAMAFFPEIFGNTNRKYNGVAMWLIKHEGIVCPNVRDLFSAKGKAPYTLGGTVYPDVPRVLINLFNNFPDIITIIEDTSAADLSTYWEVTTSEEDKISDWIDLVSDNVETLASAKHLDVWEILTELQEG